ncbi:hypothetical protein HPP92_022274 [Vanilla planifolia]|uniref:Uncharacterized protein n=1 Tax=Vanilla planifolia TaxID=51239 RepID=A0A835UD19_VANPL|nr:hypothetical protein HPP92_022274 [Vanilla planifolia]
MLRRGEIRALPKSWHARWLRLAGFDPDGELDRCGSERGQLQDTAGGRHALPPTMEGDRMPRCFP